MSITAVAPAAAVPDAAAGTRAEAQAARGTNWLRISLLGRVVLVTVLVVAVALLVFLAIGPRLAPYRTVTMLTGSMRPTIPPGAVVVDVAEPVSQLRAGQVISFEAPVAGHPVVTHRVVAVERRDGRVLIRTRGDANTGNDPWVAVVHGDTVWRVRAVVPVLGDVIRMLRSGAMHVLVVWVLPAAALLWFLVGVWRPRAESAEPHEAEPHEGGEPPCAYPDEPASPGSSPMRSSSSARRPARLRTHRRRRAHQHSSQRRPRPSSRRRR